MSRPDGAPFGWLGIFRLGLVQAALGAIVVLTTSTLNRVMVVELALPAMLPGALVALHYAVQVLRPRLGYGSDLGGRRTPWIIGGMAVLAAGGVLAALATVLMFTERTAGMVLAVLAFMMVGGGVGACGTSLLVLLAKRVDERRRAGAATAVWLMMIVGFVVTAGLAGHFLDPFSPARLLLVSAVVSAVAFVVTLLATLGIEGRTAAPATSGTRPTPFRTAMAQVWSEPRARRFTIFIFVSMLAYSAQDLILEPYAGTVFGMTPGASTGLASVQHGGVLVGMLLLAVLGSTAWGRRLCSMQTWTFIGCIASALALGNLAAGGLVGAGFPLRQAVFLLGAANGLFAVAAIGSMMGLVGEGREDREGVRMGLWGAAQAVAYAVGGFLGTAAIDLTRQLMDSPAPAYAAVFGAEAVLFLVAAALAKQVVRPDAAPATATPVLTEQSAAADC
ncbi:BCD family MFS transporter [uncultured Thiodictyon sp.]|uniref:BCD family MFS transporter n=1 Tax=uncultured Thiodictyon sp. TaxID=1846217 RepID=UPI0025DA3172|nr:BCD family MFS transporter [uncultured Thiodictyon sp.]